MAAGDVLYENVLSCMNALSLQNSIEMAAHISMDDHCSFYQRCPKPEISHLNGTSELYVYWDDVYALILRGRLTDAWEIIQMHSEVRSVIEYTSSAEDRKGLIDLQEIFVSHPIYRLDDFLHAFKDILVRADALRKAGATSGFTADDETVIGAFMRDFSSDWMRWHSLVNQVRRDPYSCPLLSRMPQLQAVLHTMAGDEAAIAQICSESVGDRKDSSLFWQQFALCRLIFSGQSLPPFSKPVVVQLIEEALEFQAQENRKSGVGGGNVAIAILLQKVLSGNVVHVLKFIYELSMKTPYDQYQPVPLKIVSSVAVSNAVARSAGTVDTHAVCASALQGCSLLTANVCAHLLMILDRSEIVPSLGSGERWGNYDAESLLEEVLLEYTTRLNESDYPIEVSQCSTINTLCSVSLYATIL